MSKHYGARCTGVGSDCADDPLAWCERIGNYCTGGTMGDVGIEENANRLSKAEFQKAMEASTTKFLLDNKGAFVEAGLFADCGLRVGDKLVAVIEASGSKTPAATFKYEAERILKWQFTAEELIIAFKRDGEALSGTMKNPAYKDL